MSRVRHTDQAEADILEIALYIAQDNKDAAYRFIDQLAEKCEILAGSPEMGRSRENLAHSLRSFPLGSYLIFYRPIEGGIEVIRILHAARDINPSFFRK